MNRRICFARALSAAVFMLIVVIVSGGVGCTSTSPAGTGAAAGSPLGTDEEVQRAVVDRLTLELVRDRASVSAKCENGVVTLYGVVRSEAQRARALAIARSTTGVRMVVDRLKLY